MGGTTGTISPKIIFNESKEHLLEEIVKCDIVCANCHRIRTEQRRRERKLNVILV
jgi:hypothetical protein